MGALMALTAFCRAYLAVSQSQTCGIGTKKGNTITRTAFFCKNIVISKQLGPNEKNGTVVDTTFR